MRSSIPDRSNINISQVWYGLGDLPIDPIDATSIVLALFDGSGTNRAHSFEIMQVSDGNESYYISNAKRNAFKVENGQVVREMLSKGQRKQRVAAM